MKKSLSVLTALGVAASGLLFAAPAAAAQVPAAQVPAAASVPGSDAQCSAEPQYFAYYRTWRDKYASWPGSENEPENPAFNEQRMDDLPRGVDVAFVFSNYVSDESRFWDVLRDEYVPNLHAQGTKLVRTVDIGVILDAPTADTPEAYDAAAEQILAEYVTDDGLDGLDVDMERELSAAQVNRAAGVFEALSAHIGPQSGTDRLFVYDTNKEGTHPLTARIAPYVSYVLVQSYGREVSGLQRTWDSYAPYVHPCQYLIGFSFYEERGADWGDTRDPFETSRAAQYAQWQPQGATKGGIFSYAVDRDGKVVGDDTITRSDFSWSKRLIAMQDEAAGVTPAAPPAPTATLGADKATVTGTGVAGAEVRLTTSGKGRLPSPATAVVGSDGTWTATLDRPVRPPMTVSVTQRWWDTADSDAATLTGHPVWG